MASSSSSRSEIESKIICRVCLDDGGDEKMISPCCCKGSSLLIHSTCLERWQILSLKKNMLSHALVCSTCLSLYRHPPMRIQIYRIISYYVTQRSNRFIDTLVQICMSVLTTIKLFLHFGLTVLLIFTNSQLELLHEQVLALLQVDGALSLAVVANSPSSLLAQIRPGLILFATDKMQSDPLFASSQVLIFERSDKRVCGLRLTSSANHRLLDAIGSANEAEYAGSLGGPVHLSSRPFVVSTSLEALAHLHPSHIKMIYKIPVSDCGSVSETFLYIAECSRLAQISASSLGKNAFLVRGSVSWSPCQLVGEISAALWTIRPLQLADINGLVVCPRVN